MSSCRYTLTSLPRNFNFYQKIKFPKVTDAQERESTGFFFILLIIWQQNMDYILLKHLISSFVKTPAQGIPLFLFNTRVDLNVKDEEKDILFNYRNQSCI